MSDEQQQDQNEFQPITSQADLDKRIGERLERERTKFADYDTLKAKAEKFDAAVEADKTELEKAVGRAENAEAEVARYKALEQRSAWAAEIVQGSDVPVSLLRGETREELEQHFTALAAFRTPPTTNRIPAPPGKSDRGDSEKGRAAAALRAMRAG